MSSDEAGTSTATGPDVVQSASGGEASQDSSGGDGATRIQFEKDEDTELAGGVVGKAFQGDRHSTGFNEVFNADAEVPEAIGRVRSKFQEVRASLKNQKLQAYLSSGPHSKRDFQN